MRNLLNGCLLLLLILSAACAEEEANQQNNFIIEFGSECGWCAGQEMITVSSAEIKYMRNIPCGDDKGVVNRERHILDSEWQQINSSFDYSQFKTLDYSECNVCVDGCDEIIRITTDNNTHELRYTASEEIDGMENLRAILTGLLEEMREPN